MHFPNLQNTPSLGKLTEADLDAAIARKYPDLHPTIAFALAPVWLPLPTTYRAALGRRRVFPSAAAAAAYEWGYSCYPKAYAGERGTPESIGWMDAKDAAEGAAGMDDMAEWARSHGAACGRNQ